MTHIDALAQRGATHPAPRKRVTARVRAVTISAMVAAVLAVPLAPATSAQAAPITHALVAGHALKPGQQIASKDGKVRLLVRRDGGVVEKRPHKTVWLVRAAKSAKGSRATRLTLHRSGLLEVTRTSGHALWHHKLASGRVTKLTISASGQVQLWRGATRVATRALPELVSTVAPPAQSTTPAPVPAPVADPVPTGTSTATPPIGSTADPSAPVVPTPVVPIPVVPTPVVVPISLPVTVPVAAPTVTGYSLTTNFVGGGSTINIRSGPSTSASITYTRPVGTAIAIQCQTIGSAVGTGTYADNRTWDLLGGSDAGNYVHDVLTTTPGGARANLGDGGYTAFSPNIPRCTNPPTTSPAPAPATTRESKAVAWAQSQLGVSRTGLTQDGFWSGWCETFVHKAFGGSGTGYGSAELDFQAQRAAGRLHPASDTNPPAGALVYYDYGGSSGYGHVSLSIGGGQTISTYGAEGSGQPVKQVSVTGRGLPYKGWAYAPDNWAGR